MQNKKVFFRNLTIGIFGLVILLIFTIGIFYSGKRKTSEYILAPEESYTVIKGVDCIKTKIDNKKYCKTKEIPYYDTKVTFPEYVTLKISNDSLNLSSMDAKSLLIFRDTVRSKALNNCKSLKDKNKKELARTIIKFQNTAETDKVEDLLEDIAELTQVSDYLSKSEKVVKTDETPLKELPPAIAKKMELPIKYAVYYWGGIINYYSDKGELILKEYNIDGVPHRYQITDKNNDFYTYDNNGNLVEYSKGLKIYGSDNQLIYVTSSATKDQPKLEDAKDYARFKYKERTALLKELNNQNSKIYKSLSVILDKHYDKGDYNGLLKELNNYFNDLSLSDPALFNFYMDSLGDNVITINIAKIDNSYIFSMNRTKEPNNTKVVASMANTINIYHGKCAEPNLKAKTGDKLVGKYFYDISLFLRKNSIIVREHPPCTACNRNISLWGWKYPKTTSKRH